ncbi:MAG: zinc ribbon domain-containing protein, partial [Ruminococcus sp.]|nr:zinc ribbon domain-containing protein [Ruminococcus sp.]
FLKRENFGKQYSSTSVFASKIICGDCGGYFGAKVWHSNSKYRRVIYQCNSKFKGEHFCTTPHLYEPEIQQKFLNAFSRYFGQKDVVIKNCLFVLNQLKLESEHNIELQAEFDEINKQLKEYIESGGKNADYSELNARYEEIAAQIDTEEQIAIERKGRIAKMQEILHVLKKSDSILETFDENIWTALVETLTVFHDGSMVFLFEDGTEVKI